MFEPIDESNINMAIRVCKNIKAIDGNTPHVVMAMDIAIDTLERQIAKKVEVKDWSPSRCPTCSQTLSTDCTDGLYQHPTFLERCPNVECNQRLMW